MGDLVVRGAGVIGLATAVMLARDGHRVTVLETDPNPTPDVPERAWESWQRCGVAEFACVPAVRAAMASCDGEPLPPVPGPDRSALLRLVAA